MQSRKSTSYYLNQFKKIDESKLSWNWSAFCCHVLWCLYRKMYFCAFKVLFLWSLIGILLSYLVDIFRNQYGLVAFLILLLFVFPHVYCGFCGNRWYYLTVKEKVRRGYHLLGQYKPTSTFLVIFTVLSPYFDHIIRKSTHERYFCLFETVNVLLVLFYWYKDKRIAKKASNDVKEEQELVNSQNIMKLLEG